MADYDDIDDDIEQELAQSAREACSASAAFAGVDLARVADQLRRIGPVPGAVSPRFPTRR